MNEEKPVNDLAPDVAEMLKTATRTEIILRSNQVAALDAGMEARNLHAGLAVRPETAREVAAILTVCNEHQVPVVAHGGRTGLAGAAISVPGELILLTDRLEGGIEIDPVERVAVVSASVTQQELQEAAAVHGLSIGIDTASRGSATIGGMISTNAGGMEAFRFGMMRDRLLGIEAVLADGTIVEDLTRVSKANEGLDLKHFLCGAEGTLGIVTKAVIKLEAADPESSTTLLAVPGAASALSVMRSVQDTGNLLLCEMMWRSYAEASARQTGRSQVLSFCPDAPAYLIVEAALEQDALLAVMEPFFETGEVIDAVQAKSKRESSEIWRIREDSEAAAREVLNPLWFDVSIPLSRLDAYVTDLLTALREIDHGINCHLIAHLGDGNIHANIGRDAPWSREERDAVSLAVERGVKEMGGAVSAEHGIGVYKLDTLQRNAPSGNLAAMKTIKAALDPKGILNPGKVFPT
ncbi:MAG: FAD-binding oxidoreductase [Pseudomonadota bacterium]